MRKRKKFLKIFTLILCLILGWGFIWAAYITHAVKQNSKNEDMKNRHAIVKNIIVTETKEEKKYWEFYAKSGEYNSENNSILLNDVIGNFYKDNEVVLSFESTQGTYDEKTKKVVLNGENLFVAKNGSQLYADELIWQGNDKDILANGNVQFIMHDKLVSKAENAVFNSALTNFKIKNGAKTKIFGNDEDKKKYTQL